MSWHFSRALVEEYSAGICWDGDVSAPSNTNHSKQVYSCSARMMAWCTRSRSGMTCEHLTERNGEELLTSFLADFHAKTSAQQGEPIEKDLTEAEADCGQRCTELLMRYDPDSRSLKTPQRSLFGGWIECSRILPRYGLMRDGECFPLRMLEHDTSVKGYGLWESIGTLVKTQRCRSEKFMRKGTIPNPYELCKANGGKPRIEWLEHLMGWPIGWTDLEPLATDKFQLWLLGHGNR